MMPREYESKRDCGADEPNRAQSSALSGEGAPKVGRAGFAALKLVAFVTAVTIYAVTWSWLIQVPAGDGGRLAPVQAQTREFRPGTNGFELTDLRIPRDEIFSGGPPRDGIPAILEPKFVSASDATFLQDSDVVIGLASGSTVRAYPLRILVWHEIVNDEVNGEPLIITYCPLCGTAMVFKREIGSQVYTFGVSGLLYNSDVLMYDHQTESLWSQLKMEAVSGPLSGQKLEWLPSTQTTWAAWRSSHPSTEVLSTDTGFRRNYAGHAYQSYELSDSTVFPVPSYRTELKQKDWVVGLLVDGVAKAYPLSLFEGKSKTIKDEVGGEEIRLVSEANGKHISATDASGNEIPTVQVYWFAWQAFYPETLLHSDE